MKNRAVNENMLYFFTMIVYILVNLLIAYNPDQYLLPMLVTPIFLMGIHKKYSIMHLVLIIIGGMIPFLALGIPEMIPIITVPFLLLFLALAVIVRMKGSSSFTNMAIASTAVGAGLILREYFLIYVVGGSDIWKFAAVTAATVKESMYSYVAQSAQSLNAAQMITFDTILKAITEEKVLSMIPSYITVASVVVAYMSLRFLKGYLRMSPDGFPEVSFISEIKANPVILTLLLILSAIGSILHTRNIPQSIYLTGFSEGVLTFIGMTVVFASVLHLLVTRFGVRSSISKMIFTLPSLVLFGLNGMILFAILDSIMDFRELTAYGLVGRIKAYAGSMEDKDKEE